MADIAINIANKKTGVCDNIDTPGYILMYLRGEELKVMGTIDTKALLPMLAPVLLKLAAGLGKP